MVSDKQRELRAEYDMPDRARSTKLVPNLRNKTKYMCHYRNLRFYLEHGLRLTKVHRVIKFDQSAWLEPYITKNTNLRVAAKNKFEKEFFKLIVNAVYGKTCENVLKRSDIRLVTDAAKCKQYIAKPHCKGFEVFSEDIAAVNLQKVTCEIDKPMYIGFSVLELSKLCMYEFHYDWILKKYPHDQVHLLFTDTDSLVYEIDTDDIFEDMTAPENISRFDLSNYEKSTSNFYDESNRMVVGKMKDEAAEQIITEVVALRPKMYSYKKIRCIYLVNPFVEEKRAKGIARAVVAKDIHFDDYLRQLNRPQENRYDVPRIGHKRHVLYTLQQRKRGLCAYDDKRWLLEDGVNTLAHGHYRIRDKQRRLTEPDVNVQQQQQDNTNHGEEGVVNAVDVDGEPFVVMSHRAMSLRPALAELFDEEEDEYDEDFNLRHLDARAAEHMYADDDDDSVIASTAASNSSDDDSVDVHMSAPSIVDTEAHEGAETDEDDDDDDDVVEVQPDEAAAATSTTTAADKEARLIDAARRTLRFKHKISDADIEAIQLAVETARYTIPPCCLISEHDRAEVCIAIRSRKEPEAARAIRLVERAQASNKAVALSTEEKLILVEAHAMKQFRQRFEQDDRGRVFQALTGRSRNWWDSTHKRALENMAH
jgi:hypothetical protein